MSPITNTAELKYVTNGWYNAKCPEHVVPYKLLSE